VIVGGARGGGGRVAARRGRGRWQGFAPRLKEDLLKGRTIGDTTYKVQLDGYNLLPFFKGEASCAICTLPP
jgi:hypothetical protein